jgi:hypothetical protein
VKDQLRGPDQPFAIDVVLGAEAVPEAAQVLPPGRRRRRAPPTFTSAGKPSSVRRAWSSETVRSSFNSTYV